MCRFSSCVPSVHLGCSCLPNSFGGVRSPPSASIESYWASYTSRSVEGVWGYSPKNRHSLKVKIRRSVPGFTVQLTLIISSASLAFLAYSLAGFIRVRKCLVFRVCLMSFALERPCLRIQHKSLQKRVFLLGQKHAEYMT